MSKLIGLPATITKSNISDVIIDLSDLNFPCEKDKQINSALLFLRNIALPLESTLKNCSYDQKSKFLFLYMTKRNMDVNIKELNDTWLNLLAHKCGINTSIKSILTNDEMDTFLNNNKDLIDEMIKLTVSIPLVSINFFGTSLSEDPDNNIDLSEFDVSQYKNNNSDIINICSFVKLFEYDEFLVIQQSIENIDPEWYISYFEKDGNRYYGLFIYKFPYLNMLNMFTPGNKEVRNQFIKLFEESLKIPENESKQ